MLNVSKKIIIFIILIIIILAIVFLSWQKNTIKFDGAQTYLAKGSSWLTSNILPKITADLQSGGEAIQNQISQIKENISNTEKKVENYFSGIKNAFSGKENNNDCQCPTVE